MEYLTQIHYKNKKGDTVLICMLADQVNLLVGDSYVHKTHKTDFNPKIDSNLPDGEYVVTKREWIHHMASQNRISLFITIEDLRKG